MWQTQAKPINHWNFFLLDCCQACKSLYSYSPTTPCRYLDNGSFKQLTFTFYFSSFPCGTWEIGEHERSHVHRNQPFPVHPHYMLLLSPCTQSNAYLPRWLCLKSNHINQFEILTVWGWHHNFCCPTAHSLI